MFGLIAHALPPSLEWVGRLLYPAAAFRSAGGPTLVVLYNLVPWIGVMAAGYGFGAIVVGAEADRRKACLRIGLGATAAFRGAWRAGDGDDGVR